MLSILSWNILQGGGSRLNQITEQITKLQPTICVFSEFRNNSSGWQLRQNMLKAGYRFQFVTDAEVEANSVAIMSKIPCNSLLHKTSDPLYYSNIISVQFEALSILGVYLPHKKKHNLFSYIHQLIEKDEQPYIITGDFNTGVNYLDQKGNSFWYEAEFKYFNKLGYQDAFRYFYGDINEYSWYSHGGNGYRYDHTLVHGDLLPIVKDCKYLHDWRMSGYSDHSPMMIQLG